MIFWGKIRTGDMALKQSHKTDEVMTNNKKMGKIPTGTWPALDPENAK